MPSRVARSRTSAGPSSAAGGTGGTNGPEPSVKSSRSEVPAADRPLPRAAAPVEDLRAVGLLRCAVVGRDPGAADRAPGAGEELVEAVVGPGRVVGLGVAAGLAPGQRRPVESV